MMYGVSVPSSDQRSCAHPSYNRRVPSSIPINTLFAVNVRRVPAMTSAAPRKFDILLAKLARLSRRTPGDTTTDILSQWTPTYYTRADVGHLFDVDSDSNKDSGDRDNNDRTYVPIDDTSDDDTDGIDVCKCTQQNLLHLYGITNHTTNKRAFPLGSRCIKHFAPYLNENNAEELMARLRTLRKEWEDNYLAVHTCQYAGCTRTIPEDPGRLMRAPYGYMRTDDVRHSNLREVQDAADVGRGGRTGPPMGRVDAPSDNPNQPELLHLPGRPVPGQTSTT